MGEVYLLEHPRLPRRDALKILAADVSADAEYRARFNREADLASKLWHPHIVSVHDRGSTTASFGSRWTTSTVSTLAGFLPSGTRPECLPV
jgi:serine/threonine protein kinase